MRTSSEMQGIITRLAERHGLNLQAAEAHLRLEMEPYEPLVVAKIGPHLVSVAHYYEQGGDLVADPDVVFFTGYGDWLPIEITQAPPGGWVRYAKLSDDGDKITHINLAGQADLAEFVKLWVSNLEAQGWLEQSKRAAG